MAVLEEEVVAKLLAVTVEERTSLRKAVEEFFSRHRGLAYMKPFVRAVGLGVARNYILLDRALEKLGYGPPSHSKRWMLARVLAYEALMGRLKPGRAQRLAPRAGLEVSDLNRLREIGVGDIVSGLSGLERLSVLYSMPRWILEEIARLEPPGLEKLLKTLNQDPARWIRIAPWASPGEVARKLKASGVLLEPDPVLPGVARIVEGAATASRHQLHAQGVYVFQDRASSLVSFLAKPRGKRVADLTAGPGGKITLAGWLGAAMLVGGDLKQGRVEQVKAMAKRTRVDHLLDAYQGDARAPPLRIEALDSLIVDPPCTDLGRLQYEPEIKMWLTRGDMVYYSRVQKSMLSTVLRRARPGTRIVYSVCTLTWRETVWVVKHALEEEPYATPVEPEPRIGVKPPSLPEAQLLLPHLHRSQGFFIAVIEKK